MPRPATLNPRPFTLPAGIRPPDDRFTAQESASAGGAGSLKHGSMGSGYSAKTWENRGATTGGGTVSSIAVVADPDRERLARTTATLQRAGFRVDATPDEDGLRQLLTGAHPTVLIVHTALIPAMPARPVGAIDESGHAPAAAPSGIEPWTPVLLLTEINYTAAADVLERFSVSDYIRASAPSDELLHRVETLIDRGQKRAEIRDSSERLRERLRNVSAAIRSTNDARTMAGQLVQGFGQSFRADHVWFTTFEDERVPLITAQWNRDGLTALPRPGNHEAAARRAADRLWSRGGVLTIDDHRDYQPLLDEHELLGWMEHLGARASAVVPVGEGPTAFGILWIVKVQEPRQWSTAETALMRHVAGNLSHGLIQGHLINAQQQVLKRLHQLDQAKTDFLATVNHELRTPLTSITACLDMIRDDHGASVPPGISRLLDIIERNSDRLRGLIEDMLTVSRHDNNTETRKTPVNIGQLLRMVIAVLRPVAATREVTITLDHAGEDLITDANEAQLEQVFTNLVSNAIKFTPRGGHVEITAGTSTEDGQEPVLVVNVADDGIGIPEEDIPQLFLRFFRASNASKARVPGTGLGLAIATDIITRHSGTITVTSILGHGSTFTVRLPLCPKP
ncbi:MAG: multi-sensor signal transduction histidine kinase [Spirosoma sp.]|nr:multi-sensor signal transduction histidine kinase [Spirosoma sp.]